jgi:hypothetical protein
MTITDPYAPGATAWFPTSGVMGAIAARFLRSPYLVISRQNRLECVMSPYRPPALARERQAAIDRAITVMDEPIELVGEFRGFSRDEMHERR